jgi:hypothetical protein
VSKTYQKKTRAGQPATPPGRGRPCPERVIVPMAQITESGQGGPAGLAAGTGLQMTAAMSEEDVARLCGPDGKHSPDRAGYRHGTQAGPVTLDGHRVPVTRPRLALAGTRGATTRPPAFRSGRHDARLRLITRSLPA